MIVPGAPRLARALASAERADPPARDQVIGQ